jgi:acetoin utilization deacetylase AcuC-like enzyme
MQVPWMKGGVGDADYLAAWELVLEPIARAFSPQVQPSTISHG